MLIHGRRYAGTTCLTATEQVAQVLLPIASGLNSSARVFTRHPRQGMTKSKRNSQFWLDLRRLS